MDLSLDKIKEKAIESINSAKDLKELEKHGGLDTEGEDIRVFKAPLKAAYENVLNGRIHNSVAIIGIQHMMLEKDKVLQAFAK